jgi:hypothetical protein
MGILLELAQGLSSSFSFFALTGAWVPSLSTHPEDFLCYLQV